MLLFAAWIATVGLGNVLTSSAVGLYKLGNATYTTYAWVCFYLGPAILAFALGSWPVRAPPRIWVWLFYATLVSVIGISTRLGVRGLTLQVAFSAFAAREVSPAPSSRRSLAALAVGVAAIFLYTSVTRPNLGTGSETSMSELIEGAQTTADPESYGEFDAIFRNHVEMVARAGRTLPFRDGETYLEIPYSMIPRQIVGEKAPLISAWWVTVLNPELARLGGGLCFGSFTEGYLNFGPVGPPIHMAFVAWLTWLCFRALQRAKHPVWVAAGAVAVSNAYHFQRTELQVAIFTLRNVWGCALVVWALSHIAFQALNKPRLALGPTLIRPTRFTYRYWLR
jgi:hypothetical protein